MHIVTCMRCVEVCRTHGSVLLGRLRRERPMDTPGLSMYNLGNQCGQGKVEEEGGGYDGWISKTKLYCYIHQSKVIQIIIKISLCKRLVEHKYAEYFPQYMV